MTDTVRDLEAIYRAQGVDRPLRISRYEAGQGLSFDVTGVAPALSARVRLRIDAFVGGGFAGQVYRVEILAIDTLGDAPRGMAVGDHVAMKILRPPSRGAEIFRDGLYALGFQAAFSLQANPNAARAGALWQTMIRRGAKIRFGDERAVVDIYATFVDPVLGSCGELSEWIEGRVWLFEVDDRLLDRGKIDTGNSREFLAKRRFMAELVRLFHDMGAPELARQYEWWSLKSQPNCLKRLDADDDPEAGLTAVDFRAGLALLPFLPMSPVDLRLMGAGLLRGSLVQFDRGRMQRLEEFVSAHPEAFADLQGALTELAAVDRDYRDGQVDVAHHHVGLFVRPRLWRGIRSTAVEGWRVRGIADERTAAHLARHPAASVLFGLTGALPLLGVAGATGVIVSAVHAGRSWLPTAGLVLACLVAGVLLKRFIRRLWGRADFRVHYRKLLTSPAYARRAFHARTAATLIPWFRRGRVSEARARRIAAQPWRILGHLPLSILPAFLHRMLTDAAYARERLSRIFVRPFRLYFDASAREAWLEEMIQDGRQRRMLTDEEADRILAGIGEPFIQKYLKSLAVHVCTLPITQIVSVAVAIWYVKTHPDLSWPEATAHAGLILAAFQIAPISPGSLVRGFYVLWLVIRERNFRDYNLAMFLSFFKYVGYLAFPIQMAYRFPALARFMAAYWATNAVHIVPVFGEHGALLEHLAFDVVFNYPLTVRRRMRERAEARAELAPRRWHAALIGVLGVGVMVGAERLLAGADGTLPGLRALWPVVILVPLFAGSAVTLLAGGARLGTRLRLAVVTGAAIGVISSLVHSWAAGATIGSAFLHGGWSLFVFSLLSILGALATEIHLPEVAARTTGD